VPQYAATGLVAESSVKPLAGVAGPTGRALLAGDRHVPTLTVTMPGASRNCPKAGRIG
jgi:hypothetical protein